MKKKKIFFFLSSMTCGGAERVAILLASAMNSMDVEVWLVLARKEGDFISYIPDGVNIIDLNCKKPIKGIFRLSKKIKEINPDGVICFGIYAGIAAAISKAIGRWNSIVIIRNESNIEYEWGLEKFHNKFIGPLLSRWAAKRSKIVVVSNALRMPTKKFLRVQEKDLVVIQNPVFINMDLHEESTNLIHPWLQEKKCHTFLAMGRLEHQKGFDVILDAFKIVSDKMDCRLIIFGEGSLRSSLEKKIQLLDLINTVDLPGITESPVLQMQNATAFVLPSRYEGFGLVLVEALAAGVQIISTNCNYGPAEILENGRYGILVPVEDTHALAEAMIDVASCSRYSERPPKEWFKKFLAEPAAKKHLEILADEISK